MDAEGNPVFNRHFGGNDCKRVDDFEMLGKNTTSDFGFVRTGGNPCGSARVAEIKPAPETEKIRTDLSQLGVQSATIVSNNRENITLTLLDAGP